MASSTTATATDALWGSTLIKTFMSARTSVSVEPLPFAREGHSDFGRCSHTSFESLRTPRHSAGRKPRTSQPVLRATGSSAQPRSNTYERPWLRSASCGYFRDFRDFLILPSGVEPYCLVAPGRFKACMAFLEREICAFVPTAASGFP